MEKMFHATDSIEESKRELKACFRAHLKPSRDVQNILSDIENSLPKNTFTKVAIWIKIFFTSLLIPLALFFFDMFFDTFLVYKYAGDDELQRQQECANCKS